MMLSNLALFVTLVVVAECSKLPENHNVIRELTDTIHRLQTNAAETNERAAETEAKRDEEMNQLKQENTDLSETIQQLKAKVAEIEAKTEDLEKFKDQQVSHQITNTASFSAYPEDGIQYPVHDIFQFPHVITNNGGHYDPSESVFTCPVNGTYYFTSSVYTGGLGINYDTATSIIIYRDWSGQSEAYCRNNGPDPIYIQCGTSVVMNCNQGQRVFLGTWYIYVHMYGSRLSNFSGFLIQADTPPN